MKKTQPKLYNYSDVVKREDLLVLLSPGIFDKNGGMYSYSIMWLNEIRKFNINNSLILNPKFINSQFENVEYQNFISENKKLANVISVLGCFAPSFITPLFFSDYKKIVKSKEVVHILTSSLFSYLLIKSLFRFNKNLKIIYTLHDPTPHDEKISKIAKKIKATYINNLFSLSKNNPNFYLHIHSSELLRDCPSFIDNIIIHSHPLPNRLVEKTKRNTNKIRFGFLGRIETYKGLDTLYDSFKMLEKEKNIVNLIELIIIGRGKLDVEKWESLKIETHIDNRIVSEIDFHKYMASIDCLILPYNKASQSGVGYLALAYDLPIIATNTGGLPEIVMQSNCKESKIIPPSDSNSLVLAIKEYIEYSLKGASKI